MIAPAVFFAHGYYGTCISGAKAVKNPVIRPCERKFGPACLLHYYPQHCGGRNPITMLHEYRRQRIRLDLLKRYGAIVTHSRHMVAELGRYDLKAHLLPWGVEQSVGVGAHAISLTMNPAFSDSTPSRLLFAGRMEVLKGGGTFLDALPAVADALRRRLDVVFAGDGPERDTWEETARRLCATRPDISIRFVGWRPQLELADLLDRSHILVLPSLWPEPFGQIGIEAGRRGVPVAAFAVGGVPDWLTNGLNGFLASGDPPTTEGLTKAIVNCLGDPSTYARLREGALESSQRFSMERHLAGLIPLLEKAAGRVPDAHTRRSQRPA
jgi:glycosyltransferase involved in cell wall biosynthesis